MRSPRLLNKYSRGVASEAAFASRGDVVTTGVAAERTSQVWWRAAVAGVGLIGFTIAWWYGTSPPWQQWWFFVALGIFLAAVFVEPFFTSPKDGVVNSVAAIAAFVSANRDDVSDLWDLYLGLSLFTLACSLLATVPSEFRLKPIAHRWSRLFGRSVWVGGLALSVELVRESGTGGGSTSLLGAGLILLLASTASDWVKDLVRWRAPLAQPIAVAALGPGLVLVENAALSVQQGKVVTVTSDGRKSRGVVVATFPGTDGHRVVVASESGDWAKLTARLPGQVQLDGHSEHSGILGLTGPGSTPAVISFDQINPVPVGSIVAIDFGGGSEVFYQVTETRQAQSAWAGNRQVIVEARAQQLGRPEDGFLRTDVELPPPHARVLKARIREGSEIATGFRRIGVIQGTEFPIGLAPDQVQRGHVAVLGMSGMGKTTVVNRLCRILSEDHIVMGVDTTGEYRRLGWQAIPQTWDYGDAGVHVYEPQGDPPTRVREFVEATMTVANSEYSTDSCRPRVICMEEAHSLVPEWNFATRAQQDQVSLTTRYMMQARKFRLSFIIVSQRTAVVSKSALSQCESYIVMRTLDETSLGYLEAVIGPQARQVLPTLPRHHGLCFGPAFNCESPVVVALDGPNHGPTVHPSSGHLAPAHDSEPPTPSENGETEESSGLPPDFSASEG